MWSISFLALRKTPFLYLAPYFLFLLAVTRRSKTVNSQHVVVIII